MACSHFFFLATSMALLCSVAMATNYTVGDDKGWTTDFNYTEWTKDKVFVVGDNLVFNYNSSRHNVIRVNGSFFDNCSIPAPANALTTGNDMITLNTTGKKWYICGVSDHCSAHQMKLVLDVVASSAARHVVSSFYGVFMAAILAIAAIFV